MSQSRERNRHVPDQAIHIKNVGQMNSARFFPAYASFNPITVPGTTASATCDVFANAILLWLSERLCEKLLLGLIFEM